MSVIALQPARSLVLFWTTRSSTCRAAFSALNPRAPTLDDIEAIAAIPAKALSKVPKAAVLGPPLRGIGKIIGVGLNYRDHAEETGLPMPKEPTLFLKATSALCGPTDDLVMPREATSVDWEVELGVVIGKPGSISLSVRRSTTCSAIASASISRNVTSSSIGAGRASGARVPTPSRRSGPFLATRDEIADPQKLSMRLSVNGATKQSGSTSDMIFSVTELVSYISRFMSLQPGDVILTGTPAGVGLGQKPPTYLHPGDLVTASIDGLGEQTHKVVASAC